MINVALFTSQLEQLLQNDGDLLEAVCDLLRAHTSASVVLRGLDGRVLKECFGDDGEKNFSVGEHILNVGCLSLRREKNFSDDEKLAANIALCVCVVLLRHREGLILSEQKRRAKSVRAIINSLSFSELEAATHVLKTLGEKNTNEGLLVAGHIADKLGFTRSVVTGALRKLEGANLIETRSLGMKGTYIRVKETLLIDELGKL
jgi:GTP-sensing pleiotropic transcriptional regulator CodY